MDRGFDARSQAFGARTCSALLACAGVGLTLGAIALSAASVPSFTGPRHYATGEFPRSVAIGDLNGDREPDVVTANANASTVSVLLNRGDGSFRTRRNYRASGGPESVAMGDLNGDRNPDLATANSGAAGTVSVLLNRGDGSFQARHDYATGRKPRSVAIGDVNGDGKPDLVTANAKQKIPNPNRGTVSVLFNKGDGSFRAKLDYRTGLFPKSVVIGDLNGDRKPDVATANANASTVSVLLNRGDGSFQARRDYATGRRPWGIAIGDLNGDGKPDLTTANLRASSTVAVLLNRGGGSFRKDREFASGSGGLSVAIGDANGDRKLDVFVSNSFSVSVLVNRGNGRFRAGVDHPTDRDPFGEDAGTPVSVASGDLNGDRRPDLVTANFVESNVSVLINRPGLCAVQYVVEQTLPAARREITRAGCRVGTVRRVYSYPAKGRVISERPKFGAVLPIGSRVNLVVSRGPKRSRAGGEPSARALPIIRPGFTLRFAFARG
jgi:hypothetical protein